MSKEALSSTSGQGSGVLGVENRLLRRRLRVRRRVSGPKK